MILINLKEKKREKTVGRTGFTRWILFALTLTLVATCLHIRRLRAQLEVSRPLSIEERESIVSLFDPIRARLPQVKDWTENFSQSFNEGRFTIWMEPRLPHEQLAALRDGKLVFTPAFFSADSMTQESWLVQVMAQAMPDKSESANSSQLAARRAGKSANERAE